MTGVLHFVQAHNEIYIPAGLADGFLTLADAVQFLYKCGDYYNPSDEHGVLWSDPDIGVSWDIENPLISEKDARNLKLAEISSDLLPRYEPR